MRHQTLRLIGLMFFATAVVAAAPAQEIAPYYLGQLERGQLLYDAGEYTEAVGYLERAAFGLMEHPALFEKAQILIALSEQGRGNFPEARTAIGQVLRTETISRAYPPADLDPEVLARFEAAVRRVMPDVSFPPPPVQAPSTPPAADEPPGRDEGAGAGTDDSEIRALDETIERIAALTRQLRTSPRDVGTRLELARSYLEVGQIDEAGQLAASVLDSDPSNRDARLILATVNARQNRCRDAMDRFAELDRSSPLTQSDLGTWFVCQVSEGELEAARSNAARLSPEIRRRPDVETALEVIGSIDHDRDN